MTKATPTTSRPARAIKREASDRHNDARPHEDKLRMFRVGRWVTDCRLAKGWTMVDVAMQLHTTFPHSHLGNQGRISELETGNGVKKERWNLEILEFLERIFQPCPPLPDEPWAYSDEYEQRLREKQAEEERRLAEAAGTQGTLALALDLAEPEPEPEADAAEVEAVETPRAATAPRRRRVARDRTVQHSLL